MTLQARQTQIRETVDRFLQQRAHVQQQAAQIQEGLIRADAELALLEELIKEADAVRPEAPPPLKVVRRGRKKAEPPKEQQAS